MMLQLLIRKYDQIKNKYLQIRQKVLALQDMALMP